MQRKESSSKSILHNAKEHDKKNKSKKKSIVHISQSSSEIKHSKDENKKQQRNKSKVSKNSDCDYDTLCLSYESFHNQSQNKYQNEKSIFIF